MTFFERPRLVSLDSGKVVYEWPDIDSGKVVSSIVANQPHPVWTLDPARARFAIGTKDAIEVVEIDLSKLTLR